MLREALPNIKESFSTDSTLAAKNRAMDSRQRSLCAGEAEQQKQMKYCAAGSAPTSELVLFASAGKPSILPGVVVQFS